MASVSEHPQHLVFHHCHFPTGTRRGSGSLHPELQYGSIGVFEHKAALPTRHSKTEASKDLLQAAWALLLCKYTRNEIVVFVTNPGSQQTSDTDSHANGVCPVEAAEAWAVEYQVLNKSDPREIHGISLKRCSSRALRDTQVNTAIDFSGSLSMTNGGEQGKLLQLLRDQHVDFADIVSPFSIELKRNATRIQCFCSTTSCVSILVSYSVGLRIKAECMGSRNRSSLPTGSCTFGGTGRAQIQSPSFLKLQTRCSFD